MRLTINESKKEKKQNTKKEKEDDIPSFAQSPKSFFIELIKIVLIALVVIIPIRYFLFQPFYVRGASMEPNFFDNEYLIIDEITYRFASPQRGDVVVVKSINNESEYLIKRIIGLPGETIKIKDGQVLIYEPGEKVGNLLHETYLADDIQTFGAKEVTLGDSEYYVLGDNRPVSLDSRSFGPLQKDNIVGRAWLRVWPFDAMAHFTTPQFNYVNE